MKFLEIALILSALASPVMADRLDLGRAVNSNELRAWDIDIRPDGLGLPEGQGTVAEGEALYSERCALCHGDFGEAVGRWPALAGGTDTLQSERPTKTIGSYWPYLSTLWDYLYRTMPYGNAQSLTNDQVYSLVAYLLYLNDIVDDEAFELGRKNFLDVPLANEPNFIDDDRLDAEFPLFRLACMKNCKPEVTITRRAAILDVTPEETAKSSNVDAEPSGAENENAAGDTDGITVVAFDPELAEKGRAVFKKCNACHKIGEGAKNGAGPKLTAVYGARIGAVEGFKYSSDLAAAAKAGQVWDQPTLDAFLSKPKSVFKKTKMSFSGLKDEKKRAAVIEYLKSFQGE